MWGVGAVSVINSATEVAIELPTTLTVSYIPYGDFVACWLVVTMSFYTS